MNDKVVRGEAISQAKAELLGENMEDRLAKLEKQDEIERLLGEIKTKKGLQYISRSFLVHSRLKLS